MSLEAPVLPCRGCGSPLAVDPELVEAPCPACRTMTRVPDALRDRARAYRRTLGAERGRVEQARRSSRDAFAKMGLYFGPPLALVVGAHVVASILIDESYQEYETYGFYGGMGLLGVAFFTWLVFAVRAENREDEPAPALAAAAAAPLFVSASLREPGTDKPLASSRPMFEGSVPGTCSTCGGQVSFVVEQANARCPYCGATVFPTPAAQQALLALAAERADLELGRASRAHARNLALTFDGAVFDGAMSSLRWVGLMAMPVLVAGVGVALALRDGLPDPGRLDALTIVGLVLAGGGVLLGGLVGGIAWLVKRFSQLDAIRRTMRAVAASAGAHVVMGVRPVLDWLDAHWAASVPGEVLTVEASDGGDKIKRFSVATTFSGRPALLVVAHAPHQRRTDLFFALHARRDPQRGHASQAAAEVRSRGYAVLVSNGGTHVILLDSDPEAFAPQAVAWLLERAAQIAQA